MLNSPGLLCYRGPHRYPGNLPHSHAKELFILARYADKIVADRARVDDDGIIRPPVIM